MNFARAQDPLSQPRRPVSDNGDSKAPYRPLEIDGVVYTYLERTRPKWSSADAANIAASLSVDRGVPIPSSVLRTNYSQEKSLTTVELNRTVRGMLRGW